jgi:hypothetical protein
MDSNRQAEQNEEDHSDDEITHTILQNMLQQNRQNTILLPLTHSIIEAILGGQVQVRDVVQQRLPLIDSETELEEDAEEPSLRRHHYFLDDDDEIPPSPKRLRFSSSRVNYFFKLSSGQEFYYIDEDIKPTLINERVEPNPIVRIIIGNLPHGIQNRLNYLSKFRFDEVEEEETDVEEDENGDILINYKPKQFDNVCIQVFSAYMREMKLRAVFRRVWAMWKIYKLNKTVHADVDPITLCDPVNRVVLYDKYKKYVFDATSLATWIESKLLYQEYGFALPMYPCNPWTNVEFTYVQMISIYYQLKDYGELRWGLITLKQHDFNKKMWSLYHKSALTMRAIKTNLWALDNMESRDLLEDFIFAMYDELRINTSQSIINGFRVAIRRVPEHWYLEKWKALAFQHLEGEHFGQNRRNSILNASMLLLKKRELFFKELVQMGIIQN